MYNVMYMCASPSSPLAPSDVSFPLVVMATSYSHGGPQLACSGSSDQDLQRAGTTDDPSDCCDRFATSNHIFDHIYTCIAASTVGDQGVGPPAAISTLEFGKQGTALRLERGVGHH